jgi:hypothetical protein
MNPVLKATCLSELVALQHNKHSHYTLYLRTVKDIANETPGILHHMLHNYNVTQFTVKHTSYKTATTNYFAI